MPFDTITTEEDARRAQRLAILRPAPLKPLPPLDHDAIKARADELYAAGLGQNQTYDGLGDAVALAKRLEDR